jgi:hypothetical protein
VGPVTALAAAPLLRVDLGGKLAYSFVLNIAQT